MFRKVTLTFAAATALFALPATAQANHRDGYYDGGRYEQSYRGDRYDRRGYDDRRYEQSYRGDRYDRRGYDDGRYYGRSRADSGRRCKGTTGTIVGGVAGALLGREVTRDRYRGRSGTTGTIIGGALGALAGRSVDKSSCRNRY